MGDIFQLTLTKVINALNLQMNLQIKTLTLFSLLLTILLSFGSVQAQTLEESAQPQFSLEIGPSIGNLTFLSLEGKVQYRPDKNKPFSFYLMYSDGMNFTSGYQTLTIGSKYYLLNHPHFQPYLNGEIGIGSTRYFREVVHPVAALGLGSDLMFNQHIGVGLGLNLISNFYSFGLRSDLTFLLRF